MEIELVTVKTAIYDSAEFLKTPGAMEFYLEEALETGDPQLIVHALGVVARAKSMSAIARKSGLGRESLYKSLSKTGSPEFSTVMSVFKALDLELTIKSKAKPAKNARLKRPSPRKRAKAAA